MLLHPKDHSIPWPGVAYVSSNCAPYVIITTHLSSRNIWFWAWEVSWGNYVGKLLTTRVSLGTPCGR